MINPRSVQLSVLIACIVASLQSVARAHVLLDHAEPAVGSRLDKPPKEVKIWFTDEIQPASSDIQVSTEDGQRIDRKDCHLDGRDKQLMIVSLPDLLPGIYKVSWRVLCTEGHKTQGTFEFEIKR